MYQDALEEFFFRWYEEYFVNKSSKLQNYFYCI